MLQDRKYNCKKIQTQNYLKTYFKSKFMRYLLIVLLCFSQHLLCQDYNNIDSIHAIKLTKSDSLFLKIENYKLLYPEICLQNKITDNFGDGNDNLYGTRNFRVVLHGIAYRGGANNYYHKHNKRDNKNPLPKDGLDNLLINGFSSSIYLYPENFNTAPSFVTNEHNDTLNYYQIRGDTIDELDSILNIVYNSIIEDNGPVYLHCWNGWHQSGYISAILLKQFCNYSTKMSLRYWEQCADSWVIGYDQVRRRIEGFSILDKYLISEEIKENICPCNNNDINESSIDEVNTIETLNVTLQFLNNSFELPPSLSTFLDQYSNVLLNNNYLKIYVNGHTDSRGSEKENLLLSTSRANVVSDYLINLGVDSSQLIVQGFGELNLVNTCNDDTICSKNEHSINRRVGLKVKSVDCEIGFESNGFTITPTDVIKIKDIVNFLRNKESVVVQLDGYADFGSGTVELNQQISELRAKKVFDYFDDNNFDVTYIGFGAINEKYKNDQDRRVQISVTYD